ncbi:MAG: hypothetical protein H7A45_16460 [Verrucomicrobiales bacterium]|nr:hypothetical protein [Verrucomicrobiales bacterium]MCP5527908.1 hypothetical protein [Verrucomicrobiales bacterium]
MIAPRRIRNVALIGFMGVGKSTVGQSVARQLHFDFVDTDQLIEELAGLSIPEIFARHGEPGFRAVERQVIESLADREQLVIATGGGVGANPEHLASLKQHSLVVCLWATPDVIWQRVRHQQHRPLLQVPNPQERIRELLAQRKPFYCRADVLMNSGLRQMRQVVQSVAHQFRLASRKPPAA